MAEAWEINFRSVNGLETPFATSQSSQHTNRLHGLQASSRFRSQGSTSSMQSVLSRRHGSATGHVEHPQPPSVVATSAAPASSRRSPQSPAASSRVGAAAIEGLNSVINNMTNTGGSNAGGDRGRPFPENRSADRPSEVNENYNALAGGVLRPPNMHICPHCRQGFGSSSIAIHIPRCRDAPAFRKVSSSTGQTDSKREKDSMTFGSGRSRERISVRNILPLANLCVKTIVAHLDARKYSDVFSQSPQQRAFLLSLPSDIFDTIFLHLVHDLSQFKDISRKYKDALTREQKLKERLVEAEAKTSKYELIFHSQRQNPLRPVVDELRRNLEAVVVDLRNSELQKQALESCVAQANARSDSAETARMASQQKVNMLEARLRESKEREKAADVKNRDLLCEVRALRDQLEHHQRSQKLASRFRKTGGISGRVSKPIVTGAKIADAAGGSPTRDQQAEANSDKPKYRRGLAASMKSASRPRGSCRSALLREANSLSVDPPKKKNDLMPTNEIYTDAAKVGQKLQDDRQFDVMGSPSGETTKNGLLGDEDCTVFKGEIPWPRQEETAGASRLACWRATTSRSSNKANHFLSPEDIEDDILVREELEEPTPDTTGDEEESDDDFCSTPELMPEDAPRRESEVSGFELI